MELINELDIVKHLENREIEIDNPKYPVFVDKNGGVAYFPLFTLTGKYVGYQRYNPKEIEKYYTYVTKENPEKNISYAALYGLHTLERNKGYVFVVEGVFDAAKLIKIDEPVVAVLSNNPKHLKNFFIELGKKTIAIKDRDSAGSTLGNITDLSYTVPEGYKDLGNMPISEVKKFIKSLKSK